MGNSRRRMPSPSLVVSFLALLVAMSGTALAVSRNAVGPRELDRNAVKSRHVDKGAIRGKQLKLGGIKGKHVKSEKLKSKHLKDGAGVAGADVIDGSLGRDDFDAGALAELEGPRGPKGDTGPEGPPGPSTGPAGGDLTGSYPDPEIAAGAVGSAAVADESLTGNDVDESSLTGVDAATVTGSGVVAIRAHFDRNTFQEPMFEDAAGGIAVSGGCTAGGDTGSLLFEVDNAAKLRTDDGGFQGITANGGFLNAADGWEFATLVATRNDGGVLTMILQNIPADDPSDSPYNPDGEDGCLIFGHALVG